MAKKKKTAKRSAVKMVKEYFLQLNFLGLLFAVTFFCMSLLPSLLPRPWLFQGLISGTVIAIGYGLGVLFSQTIRWLVQKEPSATNKATAWHTLAIFSPIVVVAYLFQAATWQNEVRGLLGETPVSGSHMIRVFVLAIFVGLLLRMIARGLRRLTRYLQKHTGRWLPHRVSVAISVTLVLLLCYWLVTGVLFSTFDDVTNRIYSNKNDTTELGIAQPTSTYRSGGTESLIPWNTLGYQGRTFVARGPNVEQMTALNGVLAKEQIRTYVGLQSAPDTKSRADLAVKELERTGAFSRKVLVVATATGTGWLEPQSVDSLEYMYNGDSAIVSQQYSYLPSWISFLVDKQKATDAGRALFDAVYGKWSTLPEDQRPKLLVYGLSLGSFGSQSAFGGANQVEFLTDGALFMGTPSDTQLWRDITSNRDKGSPEWQPTYGDGKIIRFAATNDDITNNQQAWSSPSRVLYMQHASDPVVWFSFNLLIHEPDWLKEKRGPDVSSKTRWYPFVTFFQVTVDQFFGVNVPTGHGHNYGNTITNAWASIAAPTDWTNEKTAKLQDIINTY